MRILMSVVWLALLSMGFALPLSAELVWNYYKPSDYGKLSNLLTSCAVDLDGVVWFGSSEGGVLSFDGTAWKEYNEIDGLSDNSVLDIAVDGQNCKWFATTNGVSTFKDGKWDNYFPFKYTRNITIGPGGTVWIVGYDGLARYDGKTWKLYGESDGLASVRVSCAAVDSAGVLWVGYYDQGISSYDGVSWKHYTKANSALPSDRVNEIAVDRCNVKWIALGNDGSWNGGVMEIDGDTWKEYTPREGFPQPDAYSVYVARDDTKWFGVSDTAVTFNGSVWESYPLKLSIYNDTVYGFSEGQDGSLWMATGNGIAHLSNSTIQLSFPNGRENIVAGTVADIAWSSFGVREVGLEYSLDNGATWRIITDRVPSPPGRYSWTVPGLDPASGKWENARIRIGALPSRVQADTSAAPFTILDPGLRMQWTTYTCDEGLADSVITAVAADVDGSVWVGTNNGVSHFDGAIWTTYQTSNSGLGNNGIIRIFIDENGVKYFATRSGAYRFDGVAWDTVLPSPGVGFIEKDRAGGLVLQTFTESEYYTHYALKRFDGVNWTTLLDRAPSAVCRGLDGNLWFTADKLMKYDGVSWKEIAYPEELMFPCSLAVDSSGAVWVGTKTHGIWKYEGVGWSVFVERDGIISGYNCVMKTGEDGSLWTGTRGGEGGVNLYRTGLFTIL